MHSSSITEPLDLSQSSSFAEPNKAEPGPEHQLMAVENEFQARLPADGDDEGPNTRSTAKDDADGVYVITPIAFH